VFGRRPRTAALVAVAADGDPSPGDPALEIPAEWGGRVNLGLDRLQRSHLRGSRPGPVRLPGVEGEVAQPEPLDAVHRRLLQVVMGGAACLGQAAWAGLEADERLLERAQLKSGAALLRAMRTANMKGSPERSSADPVARAWTATREYERKASARLERLRWA
jgi:hypothetical protein